MIYHRGENSTVDAMREERAISPADIGFIAYAYYSNTINNRFSFRLELRESTKRL